MSISSNIEHDFMAVIGWWAILASSTCIHQRQLRKRTSCDVSILESEPRVFLFLILGILWLPEIFTNRAPIQYKMLSVNSTPPRALLCSSKNVVNYHWINWKANKGFPSSNTPPPSLQESVKQPVVWCFILWELLCLLQQCFLIFCHADLMGHWFHYFTFMVWSVSTFNHSVIQMCFSTCFMLARCYLSHFNISNYICFKASV